MRRRFTLRALLAAIAAVALLLAAYQAGKRAVPRPATVWVTRTGSRYHRAGCRYLRSGGLPVPLDRVKADGRYRACTRCGPP